MSLPGVNPLSVSIIIPNWNGAHHLQECLDSLLQQTYTRLEIIVVDNASTDNSLSLLNMVPQVTVLPQESNLGFTGACNIGLQNANGEILVLLNNDTIVDMGWIQAIVTAFERFPDVGLVASKMLLYDRREHIPYCR